MINQISIVDWRTAIAVYAAVISTIKILYDWWKNRPGIKVELNIGIMSQKPFILGNIGDLRPGSDWN